MTPDAYVNYQMIQAMKDVLIVWGCCWLIGYVVINTIRMLTPQKQYQDK